MMNLAGHRDRDFHMQEEMTRCGIDIVRTINPSVGECGSVYSGRLETKHGEFSFTRLWYYWAVSGPVPLELARQLYATVVGAKDIRVAGHCGCPAPDDWAKYLDANGLELVVDPEEKQRKQFEEMLRPRDTVSDHFLKTMQEGFDGIHWVDTDEERNALAVKAFVDSYHIDSELGLYLFVQALKG